jgi:2-polyprenyl-3-methyl-5-hydroxy-6-metoxy-1,4-benzoquinol methylase
MPQEPQIIDGFRCHAPELAHSDENFDAGTFDQLAEAEQTYFWFRERRRLLSWAFQKYFPMAQSFLEVGCGSGNVLAALASANPELAASGSEMLLEGLKLAARKLPQAVTLFQADARALPADEQWDVIGAFDVLEHIPEDLAVLREMHRACRMGIILTVPQHPWLWSAADVAAHHVQRYRADDLAQKLTETGFRIVRQTSFTTLLMPALIAHRLVHLLRPYKLSDSFRISPWLNYVLGQAFAMDRWLIGKGIDLPFGGSLLIVAAKT